MFNRNKGMEAFEKMKDALMVEVGNEIVEKAKENQEMINEKLEEHIKAFDKTLVDRVKQVVKKEMEKYAKENN